MRQHQNYSSSKQLPSINSANKLHKKDEHINSSKNLPIPRSSTKNKEKDNNTDDFHWPIFKFAENITRFWEKRNAKEHDSNWCRDQIKTLVFSGNLLRIGRKKKSPKGYFFRLNTHGMLLYYKKESDTIPKGYIIINRMVQIQLIVQNTKKKESLPTIQIDRSSQISISVFDHKNQTTIEFYNQIKLFGIIRDYQLHYEQLEKLGSGSFATVFKVKEKTTGTLYAAKVYYQNIFENCPHKSKFAQMIYNECLSLRQIKHPRIMGLYEIFQDKDIAILIMEFVPGGDLYTLIKQVKKINEKKAATIIRGTVEGLLEMHKNNYVHRDLKLENIMIENKENLNCKLVDFGFAEIINPTELISKAGTPGYIPPEIFKLQPYTAKGDIFSMGVILYMILAGQSPFKGKKYQNILDENRKAIVNYEKLNSLDLTLECRQVIKKMLDSNPVTRISAQEILDSNWLNLFSTKGGSEFHNSGFQQYSSHNAIDFQNDKNSSKDNFRSDSHCQDPFKMEFSMKTVDLKSFYKGASNITMKSVNSIKSMRKSTRNQTKQSMKGKNFKSNSIIKKNEDDCDSMDDAPSFNKKGKDFDNLGTVPDEKTDIRPIKLNHMLGRNGTLNLFNHPKIQQFKRKIKRKKSEGSFN